MITVYRYKHLRNLPVRIRFLGEGDRSFGSNADGRPFGMWGGIGGPAVAFGDTVEELEAYAMAHGASVVKKPEGA